MYDSYSIFFSKLSLSPLRAFPFQPEPESAVAAAPAAPEEEDDDDVRYEAITEAFLFEKQIIYPCYVVLPFVNDEDVFQATKREAKVRRNDD